MKRRDVIKTAGLALLGSVVAPIDSYSASTKSLNNAFNSDELNGVSNKHKLGMNLEVSSIGLGVQNMSRTLVHDKKHISLKINKIKNLKLG